MTTYTIEIQSASGAIDAIPLAAKTDKQARLAMRQYVATTAAPHDGARLYLSFSRSTDGQRGYLTPNSVSPVGTAWETTHV